ncbi:MAG: metal-dependent hydrolase [Myxococcota bacterium]
MDSVTQAALGAVIGESTLGHRVGWRGAVWGAALATIPDLDVVVSPFLETTEQLVWHRGPSHSIFVLLLLGPIVGWGLHRLYESQSVSRARWMVMATMAFLSQPFLDVLTSYGTHVFWPLDPRPVAYSTISIIDPIYTLMLFLGLGVAFFSAIGSRRRALAGALALAISTGYMVLLVSFKWQANAVFRTELERQDIEYTTFETQPGIFNSILWVATADAGDHFFAGVYSLMDDDRRVDFIRVDKNRELIEPYLDEKPAQTLVRFSRGIYSMRRVDGKLIFEDLHIGRQDQWLGESEKAVFRFELVPDPDDPNSLMEVRELDKGGAETDGGAVRRYFDRVLGE